MIQGNDLQFKVKRERASEKEFLCRSIRSVPTIYDMRQKYHEKTIQSCNEAMLSTPNIRSSRFIRVRHSTRCHFTIIAQDNDEMSRLYILR